MCTCSFWFRLNTVNFAGPDWWLFTGASTLAGGTEAGVTIRTFQSHISIDFWNAALGKFANILCASTLIPHNWYHCIWSVDWNNPSTSRHLYIDDVNDLALGFTANDTIDFTIADWGFGARPSGADKWDGDYAEFYFAPGVYLDLSVEANRRKFVSSGPRPFGLGATGDIPTGTSPKVWFRSDGTIANNGTGGTFTTAGAGTEAVTDFQTGDVKCVNSLGTCQDLVDFDDSGSTMLVFSEDVSAEPRKSAFDYTFPFIRNIDYQSAIVSLGDNMGQRASISVTLRDAQHNDLPAAVFDKYLSFRSYTAYTNGTFWGKFRARNPYMRFTPLYLFTCQRDENGADIDGTMETRTFSIESISGPNKNGEVVITAKDTLKVADGDFAMAPVQSEGFLAADITAIATTATMSPTGTINDYPATGYICIGGNEICSYTKTGGDGLGLTRAQLGTTASTHTAQDRIQLVLRYSGVSPDLIISDLLMTYAGIDSALIDDSSWAAEVAGYLGTVYTFVIPEPTAVNKLISEIIQQIGAAIWWDDVNSQIRLQILRAVPTDAERWSTDEVIESTMEIQEQEEKRITEVSVYFAQLNPVLKLDETRNYSSVATVTDDDTESLVGGKSIKTIFARGIASGGRSVAEKLAQKYLSRYVVPPRKFNFELMKYAGQVPVLGGGYQIGGSAIDTDRAWVQDEFGDYVTNDVQITRLNPVGMKYQIEAEEMLFTAFGGDIDPTTHTVIFDVSRLDVNLQTVHDSLYAVAVSGDTVNCYVNAGVIIGSSSVASPAFEIGTFVGGVTVNLIVNGRIQGHGGRGARADLSGGVLPTGEAGGTALYTRQTITVTNNSEIWGGGGGGGATIGTVGSGVYRNAGGGGCGSEPGAGGISTGLTTYRNNGVAGNTETGGDDPFSPQGGDGGGPGQAGQNAAGGSVANSNGGAAGAAVDGTSFVTYAVAGDRQGGLIN